MSMACSICSHEKCDEINQAIVSGETQRAIASQYEVSPASIGRHKTHIKKLIEKDRGLQSDKLVEEVKALQKITLDVLEDALASKDKRSSLQAVKEARSNIELIAKLTGAIDERIRVDMAKEDTKIVVEYTNDWNKIGSSR